MAGRKDPKKLSKYADSEFSPDSDGSTPDMNCDTCGCSFSDKESFDTHLRSRKHQKKATEEKFMAKTSPTFKNEVNGSDDDDEDSSKPHCEVCDKYFSGYKSYSSHLKGRNHIKNTKKLKLKQELGDMPEVLEKENKENVFSEIEDDLGKPYARCSTCKKEFSGPESFNLHIKSVAHKKKVKQAKTVQELKSEYDDGSTKSDGEEFFSKCDVCQKSFSGITPYQIHMKSGVHAKNVEKQKVAVEMKEHYVSDEENSGYVCKECQKVFSNPLAFKSHLTNNSHEKLKAKNALVDFLTSHPEIIFTTPIDKGDSEVDPDVSDYYLVCNLCHVCFSGPESAKDHVKSKKHISAKKEKKLRNHLKEQKKSPIDEQGDDNAKKSAEKPENVNGFEIVN